MESRDGSGDIKDSVLFATVTEATDGLTPPIRPQALLASIKQSIEDYSATTKAPELALQANLNRIPQILGALSLGEPLETDTLDLWRQEVRREINRSEVNQSSKFPRKTKKALEKREKGQKLGEKEKARIQALRERERNIGN